MRIDHRYAYVNDIRMHYAVAGNGTLVLFLHGFPEYWGVWKKMLVELSRDYLAVAPDQRGYNLSSRPEGVESYHIKHLVEDIRALVDHLGHKRFHLVTQDWGALVGWSFLLRYPSYVEKFVTINMTHPAIFDRLLRTHPEQQAASQYMLVFRSPQGEAMCMGDDFAFLKENLFKNLIENGRISQDAAEEHLAAMRQPGAITAGLNWYRASEVGPPDGQGSPGGSNLLDGLAPEALKVETPVLFLLGDKDPFLLPEGVDGLGEYVSDLTIKRIPGASHWVTLEEPALVLSHVREFLAR